MKLSASATGIRTGSRSRKRYIEDIPHDVHVEVTEQFDGVLVGDFRAAYNILVCAKQKCLVHLLRDLERVEKYKDTRADWARFAKTRRRLIRDAIRLRR